jgi:glycosyltransferase involved in cell wall biosynthesis
VGRDHERPSQLPVTRLSRRGALVAFLDRPTPGQTVRPGLVDVDGWCLPDPPLVRVEVTVDGSPAGLARLYAVDRDDDMAGYSAHPGAPLARFTHTVPTGDRPEGAKMAVAVSAVLGDGTRLLVGDVEIVVGPDDEAMRHPPPDPARMSVLRTRVEQAAGGPSLPGYRAGMRLLVVTHHLGLGGAQLYLYELLRLLLADRDISCVIVAPEDGALSPAFEDLGAVVHPCGPLPTQPDTYEGKLTELANLARFHDVNAVLVNGLFSFIGADLAARLGLPAVWAIHESFTLEDYWPAAYGETIHPYARQRLVASLGTATAVVFEAEATRQMFEGYGDARRFVKVPYGVDLGAIRAYRQSTDRAKLRAYEGWSDRHQVVLCMGTYEPRKGQGALVLAFADLAQEFPHAVLALVGDTGTPYAKAVREVVARTGLGRRVRCVEVVEDTYEWYAKADVLVVASDVESLPRSVLEVMAFGVPVVATDVYGLPEVVIDGGNGFLCAPRDQAAMTAALRRWLSATPEEVAAMRAAALATAEEQFDSRGYATAYGRLLRGFIENRQALPADLLGRPASGERP